MALIGSSYGPTRPSGWMPLCMDLQVMGVTSPSCQNSNPFLSFEAVTRLLVNFSFPAGRQQGSAELARGSERHEITDSL